VDEAVAYSACQLAKQLDARAIIIEVRKVPEAAALARFRPTAPIVALAATENVCRSLALVSGVSPLYATRSEDSQARLLRAAQWLYAHALARPGEPVVVLSASVDAHETADTLQVARLPM
jgi:pyruvate kinase